MPTSYSDDTSNGELQPMGDAEIEVLRGIQ
jgi:hypothetical protein